MKACMLVLIALLVSGGTPALAETDNLLWTSVGVQARPAKRLKAEVAIQTRYDQNASELESVLPEVELGFLPTSWFELSGGLRAISERSKSGDREPAQRLHIQGELEKELGPVELSWRLRYQSKKEFDEEELAERIRNRVSLRYDTKTWFKPLAAAELFTDPVAEPIEQKKFRLTLGSAFKLSSRHRLKLRLHHQARLGDGEDTERIMSLDYRFRFPKKSRSK